MDISEVWNNLGYLAAPLLAILLFCLARRIPRKWLRVSTCAGAIVLFLISGIALLAAGYELMYGTVRHPMIVSPDGKHVAVAYWGGVLFDENYVAEVHVSVRSRFSPIATEVFKGQVITRLLSDLPNDPEVRWLDGHRLLISRRIKGKNKDCSPGPSRVAGIEVLCQE
jgi:hypothetical protein